MYPVRPFVFLVLRIFSIYSNYFPAPLSTVRITRETSPNMARYSHSQLFVLSSAGLVVIRTVKNNRFYKAHALMLLKYFHVVFFATYHILVCSVTIFLIPVCMFIK